MVWSVWYEMTNGQQLICHLHTSARHLHIFRRPEKPFHGTNPHPMFAWCTRIKTFSLPWDSSDLSKAGQCLGISSIFLQSEREQQCYIFIHKWKSSVQFSLSVIVNDRRVMYKGTFASQLFLRLALGYTWSDKGWSILEKHRKNCECCPGHHLIVDHYSSI